MVAAIFVAPQRIELDDVPLADPGPGQVRIRIAGCGVCSSNIPPYEGREWFRYPMAPGSPGHEGWGTVEAVGPDVRDLAEGDAVACLSFNAYASFDLCDAASAVKLPPQLAASPFPGEPLACAMNVFERAEVREGQTVAIIGVGFLGSLLTALAKRAGAQVIAITRRSYALEIARSCGADHLIPMDDHQRIVEEVRDLTHGEGCERVIEAVGKQWPLDLAAEITRVRGRLVVAGYHQDGPRQVDMQRWNWNGIDVINAHERDPRIYVAGMRRAVRAVQEGDLDPFPLFTHRFPLARLDEALEATRERPDGFMKAIVDCG